MTFTPAIRRNVPLLVGIAGPSWSGKTFSAFRIAKGMANNRPFCVIDTENGRALHYADQFDFLHDQLEPPFSPARYAAKIAEAEQLNPPVIVIDSMSHEHAGEGGVLDMHEAELERMAGDDYKRREAMKFAAWIKPKAERKRLMTRLLQVGCHVIVCLRAEEKVEIGKDAAGKMTVTPKRTLAGHVGWIPVCGKELPYELTLSLVVTPDAPGVPHPIKLQEQHRALVPLDRPLDEHVGERLAAWASGTVQEPAGAPQTPPEPQPDQQDSGEEYAAVASLEAQLLDLAGPDRESDVLERITAHAAKAPGTHMQWLERQIQTLRDKQNGQPEQPLFQAPAGATQEA